MKRFMTISVILVGLLVCSQTSYGCAPPPPNAVVTAPSYVRVNVSTVFDASGSTTTYGSITSYEWDWTNDGTYEDTTTTATATHTYTDAGSGARSYTIKLRVTNSYDYQDTATCTFTVFSTIQAVIDAASNGAVIELPDGTYSGTGNKNLTWSSKYITLKSANGPTKCIIDCEFSGRGFNLTNSGSPSVINGFTIKGGKVTGSNGGGIFCSASGVTVENCMLTDNSAVRSGGVGGCGGGIAATGGSPTIKNCVILNNPKSLSQNPSYLGGGIYCATNATITDCTISDNSTGGIYCVGASPTIERCTIVRNQGDSGIHFKDCSGTAEQCVVIENSGDKAGGIMCESGDQTTISNSRIMRNRATDYDPGLESVGGILCVGASPTISNCVISDNTGYSGIYDEWIGGGILCAHLDEYPVDPAHYCWPLIENCTITNNKRHPYDRDGSAIRCVGAKATVNDSIIWDPQSGVDHPIELLKKYVPYPDDHTYYSCLYFNDSDYGEGSIICESGSSYIPIGTWSSDPCFKDVMAGDYRSQASFEGDPGAYQNDPPNKTIKVSANPADNPDYSAIQRAIDWANNEDTVEIYDGVYQGPSNKNLCWACNRKEVTVKSKNGAANCIIDCENDGSGFYLDQEYYWPYYPGLAENPSFIIDGISIKNAGNSGILCDSQDDAEYGKLLPLIVKNCIISDCANSGINITDCNVTVKNCEIRGCRYDNGPGGGIYCWRCSGTYEADDAPFTIENCTVEGNIASSYGGGIYNNYCKSTIRNSVIAGNTSGITGGGIHLTQSSEHEEMSFTNCTIVGNATAAPPSGARSAIAIGAGANFPIKNCIIWNNVAPEIDFGKHDISYSCIKGGSIDDPLFVNLYKLTDVTKAAGTTTTIYVYDASKYAVNDYIEYNDDGVLRKVTARDTGTNPDTVTFANDPLGASSASNKVVRNWGNAPTNTCRDYHLWSISPCIDIGDSNPDYNGQMDIDGENRVIDTPGKGNGTNDIDMGADEVVCHLVGWWKFDGNANDGTGHGYNGTVHNATLTNDHLGNSNSAYYFDGSDDYIGLGNPAGLNFTGQITIAAWIRPDLIKGVDINRDIVVHGFSVGYPEKEVYLRTANDGQYEIGSYIQNSGTTGRAEYIIPLTDQGTWVHLVGLYDGAFWRLYRNGVEVASRQRTVGAIQVDWDWAIGARAPGSRFFTGAIDDVRIYDRALSATEIQAIYEGGF